MKHLSSEQVSRMVAGIPIPEAAHVRECPECTLEVNRIRSMMKLFGDSVREWTDTRDPYDLPVCEVPPSERSSRSPGRAPMAWVLAAAALAAAVTIPVYRDSRQQEVEAQAMRDRQLQDQQLMNEVNAQLSRNGPLAMDSLMQLMAPPESGSAVDSAKSRGIESEPRRGLSH